MHNPRLVSGVQRLAHLSTQQSDVSRRQQPVLIFLRFRQSGQVRADDVLAGDVRPTVHLTDFIRADNARVLELRCGLRFGVEPSQCFRRHASLVRTLDCHVAIQLRIVGPKHLAKRSTSQSLEQPETPKDFDHRRSLR